VIEIPGNTWDRGTIVTILAKDFAEYMCLSGMGAVIFFDLSPMRCPA
jgi:hypothetical protein